MALEQIARCNFFLFTKHMWFHSLVQSYARVYFHLTTHIIYNKHAAALSSWGVWHANRIIQAKIINCKKC